MSKMSWKERLENVKFSIKTGDGKMYFPLWKTAEKSKDFNVSKYDFINVEGSFVDRKKAQGGKFPLVFFFQGDDNIEQCNEFEISANDSRIWTIEHPFYGTIKGQPTNLKRVDSNYNVTEINIDFWESIEDDYPLSNTSIKDSTLSKVSELNTISLNQLVENSKPSTTNISGLKDSIILTSSKFTPDSDSYNKYVNLVKTGVKDADKLVTDSMTALGSVQDVISYPAEFVTSAKDKINSYKSSYDILKKSIGDLFEKYLFESQASTLIAGMCLTAVTPQDGDYVVRSDIESINNTIKTTYDDYLKILDSNQVSIYDVNNNWTPNALIQSNLMSLVSFTSKNLFLLSFDARQERLYELTEDSNLIVLTHRFLGLDADDANIESFRKINNIKNDELYRVRKGRTIKYFV